MTDFVEITAMPQATPNVGTKDVRFALTTTAGNTLLLRARYGVIAEIASMFGACLEMLRIGLQSSGEVVAIAAPSIVRINAQKDAIGDSIILSFISEQFIPYEFRVSPQEAEQFADLIKAAVIKRGPAGNA
jgi:hypothetical protein